MPQVSSKQIAAATATYRRPHHRLVEHGLHLLQPWMLWVVFTVSGLGLRYGFPHLRLLAMLLAIAAGSVLLVFSLHLSKHRSTLPGRVIGPVTAVLAVLSLSVFLIYGFSVHLCLVYLIGGGTVCSGWDLWMLSADTLDLAAVFNAQAGAAGAPGARMTVMRQPRGKGTGRGVVKALLRLPADPAMTAEETADRVGHFENVTGRPAGSFSLSALPDHGGVAEVTIAPPGLLTARPLPWPGPSAPGADMSVPFRISRLADGRDFLYPRLPIGHRKVCGRTGSGKTETVAWNLIAEGITREGYAAMAIDIGKGEQFLGPLRPALHHLATDQEGAAALMAAWHRMRLARHSFLAKSHLTEWAPGCRLSFLDLYMEEAADILLQLGTTTRHREAGQYMVSDWAQDVAEFRSAGISVTASFQRPTKDQAVSAVALSQMGSFCFGVSRADDMVFGLSPEQRDRGARPTLFSTPAHRGMFYADTETVPEDVKAMPMRGWYWGPGAGLIAEYAAQWPASARPLDDVTGEALEAVPGPLASTAFPAPIPLSELGVPAPPDDEPGDEGGDDGMEVPLAPVRQLFAAPKPRAVVPERLPAKPSQDEAEAYVRAMITRWQAEGVRDFIKRDWDPILGVIQRSHSWLYNTMFPKLVMDGILMRHADGRLTRWEILIPGKERR